MATVWSESKIKITTTSRSKVAHVCDYSTKFKSVFAMKTQGFKEHKEIATHIFHMNYHYKKFPKFRRLLMIDISHLTNCSTNNPKKYEARRNLYVSSSSFRMFLICPSNEDVSKDRPPFKEKSSGRINSWKFKLKVICPWIFCREVLTCANVTSLPYTWVLLLDI